MEADDSDIENASGLVSSHSADKIATCTQENSERHHEDAEHQLKRDIATQIPDGGYGWVVVAASFISNFIAAVFVDGFSVTYVAIADYFQAGKAEAAWIGSLALSVGSMLGRWYVRTSSSLF